MIKTESMSQGITTIDFRSMIQGPFKNCPKCGKKLYGVLSVHGHHYIRRCRECWHTSNHIPLPTLKKRVIYLDQFAISEMAKLGDKTIKRRSSAEVAQWWQTILENLRLLVRAQMVVCPESECTFANRWSWRPDILP